MTNYWTKEEDQKLKELMTEVKNKSGREEVEVFPHGCIEITDRAEISLMINLIIEKGEGGMTFLTEK